MTERKARATRKNKKTEERPKEKKNRKKQTSVKDGVVRQDFGSSRSGIGKNDISESEISWKTAIAGKRNFPQRIRVRQSWGRGRVLEGGDGGGGRYWGCQK